MKKLNRGWLFLAVSTLSLLLWWQGLPPAVSKPVVQLQSQPALEQVVPFGKPTKISLQAVGSTGQPLPDAQMQLRLLTPPKTPWLTSDFPIVEGTTLLELNAPAPGGTLRFEQTLPIRGQYQLEVQVAPRVPGAFPAFAQTLQFSIPENPIKYRNLAILVTILLLVGFGGGWVLAGNQQTRPGEIVPERVRLVLSGAIILAIAVLLIVNLSAERASSHSSGEHGGGSASLAANAEHQSGDILARLSGDQQATVGKMATQTVEVRNAVTDSPVTNVRVRVQAIALEDKEVMFAYEGQPDANGQLTWQEQFFDGAPHRVSAEVMPVQGAEGEFQPFQVSHEVEVAAIAPPLSVRLITLFYFTAVFAVGLMVGLFWHRRPRLRV